MGVMADSMIFFSSGELPTEIGAECNCIISSQVAQQIVLTRKSLAQDSLRYVGPLDPYGEISQAHRAVALDDSYPSPLFYGILGKETICPCGGLMFATCDNPSKNADVASIGRAPHS